MKVITFLISIFVGSFLFGQACEPQAFNMTKLDSWAHPNTLYGAPDAAYNDVWAYENGTNAYAIIGGRDSFYIIDVTDPTDIFHVQSVYQGDLTLWRDFKVYGDYLYTMIDGNASSNYYGVVVYDLSGLPGTVTRVVDLDDEFGKCHNIYIDVPNARLYAVGMPQNVDLCVYDLTDPGSPVLGACYNLDTIENISGNGYIHDIFVRDNIAYGSHGYGGYHAWDMTDLSNVEYLGGLDNNLFDAGYVHSSWNSEDNNYAVVATELGSDTKLYWINQSDLTNIQVLDEFKDPLCDEAGNNNLKRPHNPYVLGDKIYSSYYHDGLITVQIQGDQLERVAHYDTYPEWTSYSNGGGWDGAWGAYPFLSPSSTGGTKTILASDQKYGLFTLRLDITQKYTFEGPGTDWDDENNWLNNQKPYMWTGESILINHDCIVNKEVMNSLTGNVIIKAGVTVTYE